MTAYAKAADLTLTAYRPLAEGRVSTDPVLQDIANRHGTSPATVALAFLIAEGRIVIPASTNPQRLRDNLAAQTLGLSEEEIRRMRRLDRGNAS
ncbi:aldo/keto reductase (plasmid) [Rhizobium acidisoli]|uniref:Aldo/keto reductase n=1 Tax=Rhizobium acidisoli TaxID=1538158 RepID=A0AAE5WRZ1_9HYPH|nr:aldo/keto reductase [Rhizobium acidisoli]QAS81319.1 aldo/keto reductase [Rhizobium acidisoli]